MARAKHRGRRLVVLAAAVAVPAFAAPSGWDGLTTSQPANAPTAAVSPLGFELAGESFPGSAFYYLVDEQQPVLPADADLAPDAQWDNVAWDNIGLRPPLARPMILGGTATDQSRALQCMSMAIYYEAASESAAGQRAVAQVVLNRVAHPTYPNTVCGVVFQGSARKTGCQFSFTCDGALARRPSQAGWERARRIARDMLHGGVYAPVGLSTHYHTIEINPYWAPSLNPVTTIGAHRFYSWKGKAGQPAAFLFRHNGGEPAAAPSPQSGDDSAVLDPVKLAAAYEARIGKSAEASPSPKASPASPLPAYSAQVVARGGDTLFSGERLPSGGGVRPEYANSGQWIGSTD